MKRKFYHYGIPVLLIAAASAASCVNKDYKVNDLNYEVHLAPDGVSLPLATIDNETLADLFKNQGDLIVGDDGYYAFRYGDEISFTANGIYMEGIDEIGNAFHDMSVDLGIPSFDFSGDTNIEGLDLSKKGTLLGLSGAVTAGQARSETIAANGEITVDFGLPGEVGSVGTVWVDSPGQQRTLVNVTFDLGELQNANGGVVIDKLVVNLPQRYSIVKGSPSAGSVVGPANVLTVTNYNIGSASSAIITFYIETMTLADKTPTPIASPAPGGPVNEINFTEPYTYELKYTLTTRAGNVSGSSTNLPVVRLAGAPAFKDATFTTRDITVDESDVSTLDYLLTEIAEEAIKIVSVDFAAEHKTIKITVGEVGLPFSSEPDAQITFPPEFSLTDPRGNLSGSVLTVPLSSLAAPGYELQLNSIGLGDDHGIPTGGTIDFSDFDDIKIEIDHTFVSEEFLWSRDIRDLTSNSVVDVSVDASELEVATIHVYLDLPLDEYIAGKLKPIDLSGLTKKMGDEDEQHPDLAPPTISMTIDNSAGIEIEGDLTLDPRRKDGTSLGLVDIDNLLIEPSDNEVTKTTCIFIAQEGTTAPTGYTPYYTDLENLMGTLPTTIEVALSARATADAVHTIHVKEDFKFAMAYSVDMPITFGEDMSLVIEITEDGLNETFSDLAGYKVKAADISTHAQLTVSFPLKMSGVEAEFLDAAGASIPGLVTTVTGVVEGPQPGAEGAKTSTLEIAISVPDGGDFQTLSEIDRLTLRLPISGTGPANRLKPTDYISGKVWLTLGKGAQIDLNEL